jgi:hypothetical protein
VAKFVTEQRRLTHRGRSFHFVSYDAVPVETAHLLPSVGPAWFLMSAGKRWPALPRYGDQDPAELDLLLAQWLDVHVFGGQPAEAAGT